MDEQLNDTTKELASQLEEARRTIERYRAEDERRRQEARAKEARDALQARMEQAMDGRTFVHARLNDLILEDFRQALDAPANAGLSDREVFDALTEGQGYFAGRNPPLPAMAMPGPVTDVEEGLAKLRAVMRLDKSGSN